MTLTISGEINQIPFFTGARDFKNITANQLADN